MQLEASILIGAPRARVFALYADCASWPRVFASTIRGVRLLSEEGETQTIEVDHVEGPVLNRMTLAPPAEIRLEEHKRHYDALFTNRFDVDPGGTRYTLWAEVRIKGWLRLLSPLATLVARRQMRRFVLEPLKQAAEQLEPSTPAWQRRETHRTPGMRLRGPPL
jgi:hypothetical protein